MDSLQLVPAAALHPLQLIAGLLRDPITSMRGEYISKVPTHS